MSNHTTDARSYGSTSKDAPPTLSRQKSAPHPRYPLKQAEELAKSTFEMGARRCDQKRIAQAAGYKGVENGSYRILRASANHFELTLSEGDRYISVTEPWIQVFNSEDPQPLRQARQEAMLKPELYRQLMEDYADRMLPSVEKLARDLHLTQRYGILRDVAEVAARVFLDSAHYAGLVDVKSILRRPGRNEGTGTTAEADASAPQAYTGETTRVVPITSRQQPTIAVLSSLKDEIAAGDLTRMEILLLNGMKAYFFLPQPLPYGERERLKKYIDLVLEETPPRPVSG